MPVFNEFVEEHIEMDIQTNDPTKIPQIKPYPGLDKSTRIYAVIPDDHSYVYACPTPPNFRPVIALYAVMTDFNEPGHMTWYDITTNTSKKNDSSGITDEGSNSTTD